MEKTICELFAGVGGFRLGFENTNSNWKTVWFSQWEPGKNIQHAHNCYVSHFGDLSDVYGELNTNKDISLVNKESIPDHNLLVGGFPCQDYSVASTLNNSKGIEGKKGVLWWQIRDTIEAKKPSFCLFENVDRLLKSPAKQRGRDFGVMLYCLYDLGYAVEWRVINAADYGASQRRRRVFIVAYKKSTNFYNKIKNIDHKDVILKSGILSQSFPVKSIVKENNIELVGDILDISNDFKFEFFNAGFMINNQIYSYKIEEKNEDSVPLRNILEKNVSEKYFIDDDKIEKWKYLKGSKKLERIAANGHKYTYSEGPVAFPENLDNPGRTILTSESTVNRSSHVVEDLDNNKLRIITPIEAERMQGFKDDWTNTGMTEKMRYFCMGNALVVPMVERIANVLNKIFEKE